MFASLAALALFSLQPSPAAPAAGEQQQPSPAFMAAAQTFGRCVEAGVTALPTSVTPEVGAQTVLDGCQAQKTMMRQEFVTWVNGSDWPAEAKTQVLAQYDERFTAQALPQITTAIQRARATPTPTPQ